MLGPAAGLQALTEQVIFSLDAQFPLHDAQIIGDHRQTAVPSPRLRHVLSRSVFSADVVITLFIWNLVRLWPRRVGNPKKTAIILTIITATSPHSALPDSARHHPKAVKP